MRAPILPDIVPVLVAVAVAMPAAAQNTRFSDRGDRDEGVITTHEISGGYFSLSGVQLETEIEGLAAAEELTVTFWLPETERPVIKVWLPAQNYWMVPHRREFDAGEQGFSWPVAAVIEPLGVDVTRLQVLIVNEDQTLYFPARLQGNEVPVGEGRYVFSFVSRGGVYLQASIARMTENGLVAVKEFAVQEDFPGNVRITWDGRDRNGSPAPAGTYHLQLEGEIWLANRDDRLSAHVPFAHRGPPN